VRGKELLPFVRRHWRHNLLTAALGLINYVMAMYALGLGAIAEIAALRETSVVFAAFLGARYLKERHAGRRIIVALTVLAGIVVMRFA
jgi:drug/metabolite transporter (DMT)-like permease